MPKATVKCDWNGCSWKKEIEFDDIPSWHQVICPECGKCVIVDDSDMDMYNSCKVLKALTDVVDPENKLERTNILIDTAPVRRGEQNV